MKNGDVILGAVGTAATFGLNAVNVVLGSIAGALTVAILVLRFRREWRHRNDPPPPDE